MTIALSLILQILAGMNVVPVMLHTKLFGCDKEILFNAAIVAIPLKAMPMTKGVRSGIHVTDVQNGVFLTTGLCVMVPGMQVCIRVTPTKLSYVQNVTGW